MSVNYVKVKFELEIESDFPPVGSETLNAIKLDDGNFKIDNTPFFAECVAYGDVVSAKNIGSELYLFDKLVSLSSSQSISIIILNDDIIPKIKGFFESMSLYVEYGEFRNGHLKMFAVCIEKPETFNEVRSYLHTMEENEDISFAELSLKD